MSYTVDFLLNICAILFAFTAYASAPIFLNVLLVTPAVLLLLPLQQRQRVRREAGKADQQSTIRTSDGQPDSPRDGRAAKPEQSLQAGTLITRPFLTNYRGALLVATCLAILAVDFSTFPRRFAKVETWGTSMMDLGVGNFVFSAGIVGARPVIREEQKAALIGTDTVRINFAGRMLGALRHSLPLLVLGIARLLSVKNLDYAEHVTEYGVHWNFFFTLALLPPFVEAVDCCLALLKTYTTSPTKLNSNISTSPPQPQPPRKSIRYDLTALLITTTYELILNNTPLLPFILISPRTPGSSLLSKNREGIFSFFGYLAIFLAGRSTGILVCQFHLPPSPKRKGVSPSKIEQITISAERIKIVLPQLLFRAGVYTGLYLLATNVYALNLGVSRRLANLPYVLWTVAYNNAQLFLFALVEGVGRKFTYTGHASSEDDEVLRADQVPSPIMRAFNGNGLAVFLVANLLTGLVNLSINTLDMNDAGAMGVLIAYAGVVSLFAVLMDVYGVKVKL